QRRAGDGLAEPADLAARRHDRRYAPAGPCDPDARSRPWWTSCEQDDQRICRAMALRGAGRRRPRELSLLSFAASSFHTAARRSRPLTVGAVPDHEGKLSAEGDPRPHGADLREAAAEAAARAVQAGCQG